MAIIKDIKKKNGAVVSYHRIALINIQVEQQITLLVLSYVDEKDREYEKAYARGDIEGEPEFPYVYSQYISFNYDDDPEMFKGNIVQKAYNWLKKHPDFAGAKDAKE